MAVWNRIPDGTRIEHLSEGYEGWIDGITACLEGSKVNPDGKTQYRIFLLREAERRRAAEEDIKVSEKAPGLLERYIWRREIDNQPHSFSIYALGKYHAWPGLHREPLRLISSLSNTTLQHTRNLSRNDKRPTRKSRIHTSMINRLKDGDLIAIDYFYHQLNGVVGKAIPIAIVPSHDPNKPNRGLIGLVEKLEGERRVDATSCLVRHKKIIPSHDAAEHGQDRRDMNRHLSSIKVCNASLITSKTLLLLDDIVRTGTSLMACRKLLLDVGASKVICLALGRATQ